MGVVYLVEQLQVGNRLVALKVLHQKLLDDKEFLRRFETEAASMGKISHPNVVTIYDSGQTDDGTPYIAMECMEGETLAKTIQQRGPLPLAECAEIILQAARGLDAAHRLGIIHRDLKPDNIFLTRGAEGRLVVKVGDFGIAKPRESTTQTATGMVLGTPQYMSREQASGMPGEKLDARSDLNSLGIIAYEMLTGRRPYRSGNTPLESLHARLTETPLPLRAVNPDLPDSGQIENVVMKALADDRNQRYASVMEFAQEFANALQAIGAALPPTKKVESPVGTEHSPKPSPGRNPADSQVESPFGTEHSPKFSPEKSLAASQQALVAIEQRLNDTTKILLELIALEGDISEHKTCGCERCSSCTIRVSGLVDKWLKQTQHTNTDFALAQLEKFAGFPRALVRMVMACQRAIDSANPAHADQAEMSRGVLVTQIESLCKQAERWYAEKKDCFLPFSRVVRALDLLLPDLKIGSLGKSPMWPDITRRVADLKGFGIHVEEILGEFDFGEDRRLDRGQTSFKGMKRVEGGGYLRAVAPSDLPNPDPSYVIDFSKEHILVVTKDQISGKQTGWEFFPTQRELPFIVNFRPVEQGRGIVQGGSKLHECGEHYQLLKISRIEPWYYYLALCARSFSKHPSVAGDRLAHAHDWPEPLAFTEHR